MGKGGGSTGTNWQDVQLQQEKFAHDDLIRQQTADKAAADKLAAGEKFNSDYNAGYHALQDRATAHLKNSGLNVADYTDRINEAIDAVGKGINTSDPNPGQYFKDSIYENLLGNIRDESRTKYTNQIASHYSPGFENKYFADTADDPFIDSVLSQQKQDAVNFATRAKDRGQLDDVGFAAAMRRIGEMESTGRSTAQKLGGAVLQGNRTRLADVANEAKSTAGSYELGQEFDPSTYYNKFDTTLANETNSLEGDVRGALEGQKFFDVGDLLTKAGAAQGASNPQVDGLDALAAKEKLRNAPRGLGSGGGVF